MQWQQLDPQSLLKDFGTWILPDLLSNNRVIGLLGLAEQAHQGQDESSAWILRDDAGKLLHLIAHSPREIALASHPQLRIAVAHVSALKKQFPEPWVITCHGQQCPEWMIAAKALRMRESPLLSTWLYQVDAATLTDLPDLGPLHFRQLKTYQRGIGQFIAGFMQDALQQKVDEETLQRRFEKEDFFGLMNGNTLISLAAATRRNFGSRCLSYVYTPPRLRGRNYAFLTVGYLTRYLLDQPDLTSVFLYADQTNPASNRIYKKLGFGYFCESQTF